MSSIWSNGATSGGASPFITNGSAPTPGGRGAAKFQSALQSAGKSGHAPTQLGLSPKAASANSSAVKSAVSGSTGSTGSTGTSGTSGSDDTDDSGATISANDFLTLLVTEMQNQDPTADVDPNAYIDQLVQVNSLEQLISINQNLSEVLGAASSSEVQRSGSQALNTSPETSGQAISGVGAFNGSDTHAATSRGPGEDAPNSAAHSIGDSPAKRPGLESRHVSAGNLSFPKPSTASGRVARALDGHTRPSLSGHAIRDIPTRSLPQ